jgi:hypothetical protein
VIGDGDILTGGECKRRRTAIRLSKGALGRAARTNGATIGLFEAGKARPLQVTRDRIDAALIRAEVEHARGVLLRHDPEYRSWIESRPARTGAPT